ncbi:MAG: hypothetical protein CM1200mP2_41120 [Planctomycetaceae bacterium]|nr:MAG: hypothetical protein CM1200mP2_41120 [Planctomycetaceae bacterium]
MLTVATLTGLGSDTFSEIEGVELTGGDDGNAIDATSAVVPVTLIGGAGADTLRGGAPADVLNGSAGNDSAVGETVTTPCWAELETTRWPANWVMTCCWDREETT